MNVSSRGRFTFSGGVHPPDNKSLTCDSQIQPEPAVKQVSVMLSQHIGAVCRSLIRKGDGRFVSFSDGVLFHRLDLLRAHYPVVDAYIVNQAEPDRTRCVVLPDTYV